MKQIHISATLVALTVLLMSPARARAVEGSEILYLGGSISNPPANTLGTLDTSDSKVLVFTSPKGEIRVPYAGIRNVQYERKLAHHFGIVPLLVVALFKKLQRRHFVQIDFKTDDTSMQSVVFEIPKGMVQTLIPVIESRWKFFRASPSPPVAQACARP